MTCVFISYLRVGKFWHLWLLVLNLRWISEKPITGNHVEGEEKGKRDRESGSPLEPSFKEINGKKDRLEKGTLIRHAMAQLNYNHKYISENGQCWAAVVNRDLWAVTFILSSLAVIGTSSLLVSQPPVVTTLDSFLYLFISFVFLQIFF